MDLRGQLQAALGSKFTIENELPGGGMSRVFVATETALSRRVVVKIIAPELAAGVPADRFAREIRLAASLQQANIVPLLSAGDADGVPYYTMPFVDGPTLRERLREGPLSIADTVSILRDVARALAYAHAQGVVHRDIKPDNVLVSGHAAVVTDFGIAKAITEVRAQADQTTLTQAGMGVGTPAYMSPEQTAGDPSTDHRADIYSFGCLAYELLAGASPFAGRPAHQLLVAHMNEAPAPVVSKRADCPAGLAQLVASCLVKDPADRPQSAVDILRALDDVATPRTPVSFQAMARRKRTAAAIIGIIAMAGVAAAVFMALRQRVVVSDPRRTTNDAVAVLPFANVGGDSAQEYLADGMTDELATALGKGGGVQIVARTMSYRYKGKRDIDAHDAGRLLNASYIITGSVRRAGTRLRVAAQLTNTANGNELWQDSYDGDAKDVFALQDTIIGAITRALAPRLQGVTQAGATVADQGTHDPAAYDLYLRGRFLLLSRRNLHDAVDLFQQAIDKDTTFARAYAGLAETLEYLPYFASTPAADIRDRVNRAAHRALQLNPSLAEAHVALGLARMHAWEWDSAGAEFRRAVEIEPADATSHTQYARYLLYVGRTGEALAEARRARDLEPYSAIGAAWIVATSSVLGRHREAMAELQRGLEIDSTAPPVNQIGAMAAWAAGNTTQALRAAQRNIGRRPPFLGELPFVLGKMGKRDSALAIIKSFEEAKPLPYFSNTVIGIGYLGVGDTARALAAFDRATDAHEIWPSFTAACEYLFDPVRASAHFAALIERVGLDKSRFVTRDACAR